MSPERPMSGNISTPSLRIERAVYGGSGLARRPGGEVVLLPFVLPGELVADEPGHVILEPSAARREPRCVHFGLCGGCQYQMAGYDEQLAMKRDILAETLDRSGLPAASLPPIQTVASPGEWEYRNRIRLRLHMTASGLEVGYNERGGNRFLPIRMCPIAAPHLLRAAEALQQMATTLPPEAAAWPSLASEVELFTNDDASALSLTLLCSLPSGKLPKPDSQLAQRRQRGFDALAEALHARCPELTGAGALRSDPRSGRAAETLTSWGAAGLAYRVGAETHWITRGGFFQVNRLLLNSLVGLVTTDTHTGLPYRGDLAWDLFAGVGLFSRVLARHFAAVTAVEASPIATADLRRALARLGAAHRAVEATTLDFLRRAVLERERPDLLVLDPPRAGVGEDACALLLRLRTPRLVYVSCDPTTLARDLRVLTDGGYRIESLHLIDLFPQTFHMETVAVLQLP